MSTVTVTGVDENGNTASTTLTISGTTGLLPLADPTFVGNSDPCQGGSKPYRNTPMCVSSLAVNANGQLVAGCPYDEGAHFTRGFDSNGIGLGQYTNNGLGSAFPLTGNLGIAADTNYVYTARAGVVLRWGLNANWGPGNNQPAFLSAANTNVSLLPDSVMLWPEEYTRWITGLCLVGSTLYVVDPGPSGFADGAYSGSDSLNGGKQASSTAGVWAIPITWASAGGTNYGGHTYTPSGGVPSAAAFTVPFARKICGDRQGNLWVLSQASVANSRAAVISRYTTSGTLLQSTTLTASPSSMYPVDICADPASNTLLVCDNGRDQNIKKYAYDNTNVAALTTTTSGPLPGQASIGVKSGYLDTTQGQAGQLGPLRFVNPRAVCVDSSANIYVAQGGTPGAGDQSWTLQGPLAIVSKLNSAGTEAWRSWGGCFAGVGEPSADGTAYYERHYGFTRTNTAINGMSVYSGTEGTNASWQGVNSQYLPTSYTADPFTYAGLETRCWDFNSGNSYNAYGNTCWVCDVAGHRYVVMDFTFGDPLRIYQLDPSSQILIPRVVLNLNGSIVTNGTSVASSYRGNLDWFVERGTMNVWTCNGTNVYRINFQGAAADGTPQYSPAHIDTFPMPSQVGSPTNGSPHNVQTINVVNGVVYVSGFMSSDAAFQSGSVEYSSVGRHIWKFPSLPTSAGWPAPSWRLDITYPSPLPGGGSTAEQYPSAFAVDQTTGLLGIVYRADGANSGSAGFAFFTDNGSTVSGKTVTGSGPYTITQQYTTSQALGAFTGRFSQADNPRAAQAKNGVLWVEDDWAGMNVGLNMANHV